VAALELRVKPEAVSIVRVEFVEALPSALAKLDDTCAGVACRHTAVLCSCDVKRQRSVVPREDLRGGRLQEG
jgi:hypothetical protein